MKRFALCLCLVFGLCSGLFAHSPQDSWKVRNNRISSLNDQRNHKEAFELAKKELAGLHDGFDGPEVAAFWSNLVRALEDNNRIDEYDAEFEFVTKKFPRNLHLLSCLSIRTPWGVLFHNRFKRGHNRGTAGRHVNVSERDRVVLLRLLAAAIPDALRSRDTVLRDRFFRNLASILLVSRDGYGSFRLQVLTDLSVLPDWSDGCGFSGSRPPVTEDGTPVYYHDPGSWEAAANDGERVRYALERGNGKRELAGFLRNQFDFSAVNYRTRAEYESKWEYRQMLYDLKENETIAELADGIRKITLPDDQNYIRMYRELNAYGDLAYLYTARMRMEDAALCFQKYGDTQAYEQIIGNTAVPDQFHVFAEGTIPRMQVIFRNAEKVNVTVRRADAANAVRHMLTARGKENKGNSLEGRRIYAYGLSTEEPGVWDDCVGPEIAAFSLALKPEPHHWISRTYVDLPLKEPGAYLVRVAPGGAKEKEFFTELLVWFSPFILSTSAIPGGEMLFVNRPDGTPFANGIVRICHFDTFRANNAEELKKYNGRVKIESSRKELKLGADGTVRIPDSEFHVPRGADYRESLLLVPASDGKAWFPIRRMYHYGAHTQKPDCFSAVVIPDRPVYRPGDTVSYAGYIRKARYGEFRPEDRYTEKSVTVQVYDARGNRIMTKEAVMDSETDSFRGEFKLPADAALGAWNIGTRHGGVSIRVEEYKKPEYLLTVTPPAKPLKLGDTFSVILRGAYYFGAPTAGAEVKYKVFREESVSEYPFFGPFDWLYGKGYRICSMALRGKYRRFSNFQREMVRESAGKLDENGTLEIKVDTADALRRFGPVDFRYTVQAELRDESNRVVTASGSIVAAAKPFRVFLSTNPGFAFTGNVFRVSSKALTPNGTPVKGSGVLRIFERNLNGQGVPETSGAVVKTVAFEPNALNAPEFVIDRPGVYTLRAEVTSENGEKAEEEIPFFVYGEEKSSSLFGELPCDLVSDKGEYRPGDTAKLLLTLNKPGATVYFFRRKERAVDYECVKLDGYSKLFELPIQREDQPNTFVEVFYVMDGAIHRVSREIPVPPESKMLTVRVETPRGTFRPRQTIPLRIRITDPDGVPVSGAVTLSVFDKSLTAVAESAVPALNSFFWNWKRNCPGGMTCNLDSAAAYWRPIRYSAFLSGFPGCVDLAYYRGGGFFVNDMCEDRLGCEKPMAAGCFERSNSPVMALGRLAGVQKMEMKKDAGGFDAGTSAPEQTFSRTQFADCAFWLGSKLADESGIVTVDVPMPDNLTTWQVKVWSLTKDTRVGEGSAELVVSKDFLARLELPRFLIPGDVVSAVANIHNNTDRDAHADLSLSVKGTAVSVKDAVRKVTVPAGGHAAVSFELTARETGECVFTLKAVSGTEQDALELSMPVLVKGIDKQVNACGRLDSNHASATVMFDVPEQRRANSAFLTVNLTPGAAKSMVELLPYLAASDEQDVFSTVNRFLPALSADFALRKLGVAFSDLSLKKTARDALYSEYALFGHRPAFERADFEKSVRDSLNMILGMANSDGGWGWFSGYREISWPDTTAYVTDALLDAKSGGKDIPPEKIDGGVNFLKAHAAERVKLIRDWKNTVSETDALVASVLAKASAPDRAFNAELYARRDRLSPYGLAMLAFAYPKGSAERVMLKRNLTQYLRTDDENQTAYLKIPESCCFFWYGNENETNAAYLRLLLEDDPADPVAAKLANYLTTNVRNSPRRNSVRSLGATVRALARYVAVSGEGAPEMTVSVRLDGREWKTFRIDAKNMWTGEFVCSAGPDMLGTGKHSLEIRRNGKGAVHFNTMLNYFTLEDDIAPAGLEMKITRNYYRLVPVDARETAAGIRGSAQSIRTEHFKRVPLNAGDVLAPGDLVEVELLSEAKNDYDYVVFADSMPAGFEYVKPLSGYTGDWSVPIYCEYRERGARFYLRNMARGSCNVFYRIRAQLPGRFTALPAKGSGVYAPELKCNSSQYVFRTNE